MFVCVVRYESKSLSFFDLKVFCMYSCCLFIDIVDVHSHFLFFYFFYTILTFIFPSGQQYCGVVIMDRKEELRWGAICWKYQFRIVKEGHSETEKGRIEAEEDVAVEIWDADAVALPASA